MGNFIKLAKREIKDRRRQIKEVRSQIDKRKDQGLPVQQLYVKLNKLQNDMDDFIEGLKFLRSRQNNGRSKQRNPNNRGLQKK